MTRRFLAAVSLAALVLALAPSQARVPAKAAPQRNDYTAYLLGHTSYPERLAGRRIMADPTPISAELIARKQAAQAAAAAGGDPCDGTDKPLGCEKMFYVSIRKAPAEVSYQQLPFVLAAKEKNTYLWAFKGSYDASDASDPAPQGTITAKGAAVGAKRFEQVHATDRLYFGHEANPNEKPYRTPPRLPSNWRDADGDQHVNIVNYPMDTGASYVAGYYSSSDEYPAEVSSRSNEGEFFYMNSLMMDVGGDTWTQVLAHEFYHMIQFANDSSEDSWVNEGMADIAIEVNFGQAANASHLSTFFNEPLGDQLNAWGGQVIDYGVAYAYLTYIFEHFGGRDNPKTPYKENYAMAKAITQENADGFEGLEKVLAANPAKASLKPYYRNKTVDDIYKDWTIANYLDDPGIADGQYGYTSIDFKVPALESYNAYPVGASDTANAISPYTNRYYKFDSSGDGAMTVGADKTILVVPNLQGMPSAPHEYWGNSANHMTTHMTRLADLRGATAPSLKFSYWYDLETDWDYAYLQVSQDNGRTWEFVKCCEGSGTNPNGNNESPTGSACDGCAMTGQSGVEYPVEQVAYQARQNDLPSVDQATPQWVQADVDLSKYAGKQVLVRFRYTTDASTLFAGFCLDNISMADGSKTIWALDDAERDNPAWKLDGDGAPKFMRITPTIPNKLFPQVIKFGADTVVSRPGAKPATGDKQKAAGAMDGLTSVVAVSSLTRNSAESFAYDVTANATAPGSISPPKINDAPDQVAQPYTLRWDPASNAGKLAPKQYIVEESTVLATPLVEDAESGLGKWNASASQVMIGWQPASDKKHSGSSSFAAHGVEGGLSQEAVLTLKDSITLPKGGQAQLTFAHWFLNEGDDAGYVEASTDGTHWKPLYIAARSAIVADAVLDDGSFAVVSLPLDEYAGKSFKIRFRYTNGPDDRAGSTPLGWYVDDIAVSATNWSEIGRTASTSFTLAGRPAGMNGYRVGALYTANLLGPWSDAERMSVKRATHVLGRRENRGGSLAATGVEDSPVLALVLLALAAAVTRRMRKA